MKKEKRTYLFHFISIECSQAPITALGIGSPLFLQLPDYANSRNTYFCPRAFLAFHRNSFPTLQFKECFADHSIEAVSEPHVFSLYNVEADYNDDNN